MDLALSETDQLLLDSASFFFGREVTDARLREHAEGTQFDRVLWHDLAGQGWLALGVGNGPEAYLAGQALIAEAAGYVAAPVPLVDTLSALQLMTSWPDAGRQFAAVQSGQSIVAIGDGRGLVSSIPSEVPRRRLTGIVPRVPYGRVADFVIVLTADPDDSGDGGGWAHLVDVTTDRVTRRSRESIAYDASASVVLDGLEASAIHLTRSELDDWVLRRAVLAASEAIGASRRSLELAVDYAMNRVQFGRPIGAFQGVQHPCADMALGLDGASLALREGAWSLDQVRNLGAAETDATVAAHSALAYAHKALLHVTANSHEVFGGVGFFVEHQLHYYTRRIASDLAVMRPASEHLSVLADAMGI